MTDSSVSFITESLPSGISFSMDGATLHIGLSRSSLTDNMQKDHCCFEGWAICLLGLHPDRITQVMIDWDPIEINPDDCCRSLCERGHYYRFLYRAYKFALNYPSWVRLSHPISDSFINELSDWVMNFPTREASKSKKTNLSAEAHLERELVSMMDSYFDVSDHQFPVGLFYKEVGKKYARTSGNGSQIDLWGVKKNSDSNYSLSVFELKNQSNKEVGIISELLFYTNVMSDFVSGVFKYPSSFDNKRKYYRHSRELYDLIRLGMIKEIKGALLADYLHPLITPKVIDILKSNKNGVCYSWMTVEDFKKKMNDC